MRKCLFTSCFLALPVLLSGCSSEVPAEQESKPEASRLGDNIEIFLADLLSKPRSELAEMAEEWTTKIHFQEKGRRTGTLNLRLLFDFRLPLVVPVWRESKYSPKAGFSLPPYANEEAHDSQLAIHVARYGDLEAARKLVEPGDGEALRRIEACALEQNFPLEWTRLAALLLHAAQLRLATGDVDGGTEVVVLHRQLKSILGPRAAQSPLGAALLPRGRETLERAATVWQEDKKSELAGQAKAALAEWGEASPPPLALRHGAARGELKRALNSSAAGRCMAAANPVRALDVFEIPFPEEGLEALIACLDEAGRLDDLYITYRAGMNEYLTDPAHFAQLFEEGRVTGTESQKATGLRGRIYRVDDWTCEVTLVKHGAGLGALVHFGTGKQTQAWETLARDFGALNLDRTFEQTRFRCMPEQRKDTLVVSQPAVLAQIDKPVPALTTKQVVISRSKERDLIAEFAIEYIIDDRGCPPLHQVALPLWTRYGTPEIRGAADDQGGHLALVWEDGRTNYTLRLPYEAAQPVHFEVSDRQSSENSAQREATVLALDHAERKARVQAGKAIARLPRQLEQFELGMSRAQVTDVLPTGQAILKRAVPGMIIVTFAGEPARDEKYVIRQLFVRFANDDRAAEIRVRYADGPGAAVGGNWMAEIQSGFRKRAGSPLESPAAWASLWSDLSGRKSAARRYEWQDDLTQLMYQFDPAGVEVCLSDRPLEQVSGSGLPALEYLPRGTAGCLLDAGRNTLLQNLGITKPTTSANGALVINPPTASPYDAVLVWFEKDQVVRVVARHAQEAGPAAGAAAAGRAVSEAWSRDVRTLGWPRRQDSTSGDVLQTLGWHDDRTRVRIFWQENDDGSIRLFTEWKELAMP